MSITGYRKDLEVIETIIETIEETGINEIYLDDETEIETLNNLLNKIKLNVRDILSIKELAGINNS
jgi:hypothetical protein